MRHAVAAIVLAVALGCLAPAEVSGQGTEVGLVGGWFVPGGADFEDTDAGPGAVATLRWRGGGRYSIGVGGHWSVHAVDFTDDRYDIVGAFVEPRIHAARRGLVEPFAGARLAWVRESIRIGAASRAATGVAFGGVAGARISAGGRVGAEVAFGVTALRFGDFTADQRTLPGTDNQGRAWSLTAGLSLRP